MRTLVVIAALSLLAACEPETPAADAPIAAPAAASAAECADGGVKLEGTGLCQPEAAALLARDPDVRVPELPAGCAWTVNESMLPNDEAMLYYAAKCGDVVTTLGFSGGARSADISYERSAVFGDAAIGRTPIRLYGIDPDPQGALKAAIAEAPAAEQASCEIQPAGYDGWPTDALLIAPNATARAALPQNAPVTACGPMGVDETTVRYWRVRQGFAWFVDLGNEDPDFDAGNIAVATKGADGSWTVKP